MMMIALAAVNLAVIRATPPGISYYPSLWVFLAAVDFLVTWKLILPRPLQAFHYTFLIVFVVGYFVMAYFVSTERFHPLGFSNRFYQQLSGTKAKITSGGPLSISEVWMACALSVVLACALALAARWLESHRGWDIAAFFRGMLVGFGIANFLVLVDSAVSNEWGALSRARIIARLLVLGICMVAGGVMGLYKLKSRLPGQRVASVTGRSA